MIHDSKFLTFQLLEDYDKTIKEVVLPKEVVKRLVYTTFDEVATKLSPNAEFQQLVDRLDSMRDESLEFIKDDKEFVKDFMEGIIIGGFVKDDIIDKAFDFITVKCHVPPEELAEIGEEVTIALHQINKDYNEEDLYDFDK